MIVKEFDFLSFDAALAEVERLGLLAISGGVGQDTAQYDAAMKTVYEDGIVQIIPNKFPLLGKFEERDAKDWGGRYIERSVKVGRNQGVGAYSEMGALPQAGRQQYATERIGMRYLGGRVQLSSQVMKATNGPKNAFESAMDSEMKGLANDLRADMARQIWHDGRGILGLVNGDPSTGVTITVDAPGGVAGSVNGTRYIGVGSLITFVNPATGAIRAASDETVTAVATSGLTFTIGSAAASAIADNDYIVRANKAGLTDVSDTSYLKEPMGMLGLNDDGTYLNVLHNVSRTTYPLWQNATIAVNGAISVDVIQRGLDLADQRGDGSIDTFGCHQSVRRAYIGLTDEARRYMGSDLSSPDAGTRAAKQRTLAFGGIPIETDKYAPYGQFHGWDTSSWVRYVEVKGEWMDEDGAIWQRMGSGSAMQDAFEAFFRIWHNFAIEKPNTQFRLDGITATVAVVHLD